MQMRNQLKLNNNKIKKSHTLLIGSFLIFVGFIALSWNYFLTMRDQVYSDMKIAMMDDVTPLHEVKTQDEIVSDISQVPQEIPQEQKTVNYVVDYSKYFGILEIPKIGLKRGFYNTDSKYNNIKYNVTLVNGSQMPDVENGNLILMAHSGGSYVSYFRHLYRLNIGDMVFVTYNGIKYQYQIVNIYDVDKIGSIIIHRNKERTTLTMFTCTHNNDYAQTVYISELVSFG